MSYDVVVVGGGASGCLIAGRLAAETDAKVLLIEAGGTDWNPLIHIPAGFSKLLAHGQFVWPYKTVPQPQLDGRQIPQQQGKGLGGGDSINAMCVVRGQAADFDGWSEALGGEGGWSFDALLPHFRGMEANDLLADAYHGSDGPFGVSQPVRINPLNLATIRAFQQVGLAYNADYNGADQRGVGPAQVAMRKARRVSAATAFLHPAQRRPNLTVLTRALATGIAFDGDRAIGVDYVRHGKPQRALAGEVVVCAGAFNSPRLLMLSGIGPEAELARHGVAMRVRAEEVGANLQDHPQVSIAALSRGDMGYAKDAHGVRQLLAGVRYLMTRDGPAASNANESIAFFNPDDAGAAPTIQCFHSPVVVTTGLGAADRRPGLTLEVVVLQPRSRGRLTLRDADPRSEPLIDPGYLADPEDMRRMLGGLRYVRKATRAPALQAVLECELTPGNGVLSDEDLAAYARRTVVGMWHPVGACRMGADKDAVVDPYLRVLGVRGLRVADSSIMPTITSGNTHAPTLVIASKAAELLKS